ncbi:hypothetical protein BDZ97DRAFT_1819116 [Flammula alnicola]|nr:hypothetical protein BDZ97DRAFT_1819116 [Flammula alnicola]
MTPEHLVDSAKLYDYYVNGFTDGNFSHKARVHLSDITPSSSESAPSILSAPSLMDLLNADNIEPADADIAVMEELWFNNPDPYDLDETERTDIELRSPPVIRSSTRFEISTYVKLDDSKLTALITKVDTAGPGVGVVEIHSEPAKVVGKPGEWSVDSFF